MKSKSSIKRIIALLVCLAAMASCFAFAPYRPAEASGAAFEENPFEEVYEYGETLGMPRSLTIVSGGQTYTADKSYIRFPDGKTYTGGRIELNSYGAYTVIYEATADGKTLTATHSFAVKTPVYSVDKNSTYEIAQINKNFGADVKGLSVRLAAGETFTLNKPVNVYETPRFEIMKFNVMHFDPIGQDVAIRLTDCHDPSTYVEFAYKKTAYDETYLGVGANGKSARGLTKYMNVAGEKVYFDGDAYKVNVNGALIPSNRQAGKSAVPEDRYNNVTLWLDSSDKSKIRVYAQCSPENINYEQIPAALIAEFNNPDMYNYTFDGFTTGEVFVSVTAKTVVNAESVEVQIASLCGVSGEDLAGGTFTDATGPQIEVNADTTSLNVMAGVPISVPTATAVDPSGIAGDVEYSVYYAYGTAFQKNVSVTDGKFTPHDLGEYTVVYTAKDVFGNESQRFFTLNAAKEGEEGIEFVCDEITGAVAGEVISLGSYSAKSLNSVATVTVSVTGPDGSAVKVGSDMKMLVERSGKYTVKYEYSDGLYSGSRTIEFTATDGEVCRFDKDTILLPKYMIKGAQYSAEKINAHLYSSSAPAPVQVNYAISYDGGAFEAFNPDSFAVAGSKTLTVRYSLASDPSVYVESDEIKIVDVGYTADELDASKYFVGDYAGKTDESTPDFASYAIGVGAAGSLEFVNPLVLSGFSFRYAVSESLAVGSYTFRFTDYYDRSKTATVKFVKGGVEINGRFRAVAYSAVGNPITVSVGGKTSLTVDSTVIECDLGLDSDKVLFGIGFENVTSAGTFNAYSLGLQSLGYYVTSDNIAPVLSVAYPDRTAKIGDVVTLARPEFADVLSPSPAANCTVSVYKDGNPVTSEEGVVLKNADAFGGYTFKITGFGSYLVLYRFTDGVGKKAEDRYEITVTDVVPPEITLNGYNGKPVSVGVNKDVSPLSYNVSDNISAKENIKVTIIVYDERGVFVCASNDKFKVEKTGRYTVYVYCRDEVGNTAYASYEINAK